MVPVVTKEVLERFTQQTLAAESPDALEEGLQFYLFALGAEDHQAETRIRNQLYDLVQSGSAAPSVSDSRELSSSKVVIPTDNFGLTTAMQLYSIALDVYLGVPHAFAEYYRTWLRDQWAPLQQELGRYISQVFQGDAATAYARFGRWISLRVNEYLVRLSRRGATTPLPDLDKFATLISTRENPFPPYRNGTWRRRLPRLNFQLPLPFLGAPAQVQAQAPQLATHRAQPAPMSAQRTCAPPRK
jgi:hypothetical protein